MQLPRKEVKTRIPSNLQSPKTRTPSPVRDQSKKMLLKMSEMFVKELVVD
jgi:hypothetical protein